MEYYKLSQAISILLGKYGFDKKYMAIPRWNGVGIRVKRGKHLNISEFENVVTTITNELRKYGVSNIILNEDELRETLIKIEK